MKKYFLVLFVFVSLVFVGTGCKKTIPEEHQNDPMDEIKVPDGFTFTTTKTVELKIVMPSSIDFHKHRGRYTVYTDDPAKGGKQITSGSFDQNGTFKGSVKIPASENKLYVSTVAGSATVAVNSTGFKSSSTVVNFGEGYGNRPPDSLSNNTKSQPLITDVRMKNTSAVRSLVNVIHNGDFEVNHFGAIAWWSTPHPVDGTWYITQKYAPAEWYNDGGNHVVRTPYANGRYAGGVSQMINVDSNDIVTFSADIKATTSVAGKFKFWLYLIPKDANGHDITYIAREVIPPPTTWTNYQVVGSMPAGTKTCQVLLWAHDLMANQSIMFDNVVVTVEKDSDGDGVPDNQDDYPNDSTRAFNVYYPNQTDWGTLAFEDLWPGKGDYDFNDLIYDYQFQSVLNAHNKLVEFFVNYSVRAVGASLENGFGFQLGGAPSNVASVTGTKITENYIHLNNNGTEQGQSETVIIVFDNAFNTIGQSGKGFVNTLPGISYISPDTNRLHVLYVHPVDVNVTGTAPYNPFMIVGKNRGKEIHLAGKKPTALADPAFFGTWADDSNPATGKYYQTVNNLPWALDLPVSFDYPFEKIEINQAYNHFVEWAESGGTDYPDWYKDKSGYRNNADIYSPPTGK